MKKSRLRPGSFRLFLSFEGRGRVAARPYKNFCAKFDVITLRQFRFPEYAGGGGGGRVR